jgi:uncharacterized RDD family membrane protein YckC
MNRYQTIERRLGALIVDLVVLSPLALLDYLILSQEISTPLVILWLLVSSSAGAVYHILLQGFYGQTLGKMLLGVKVVRNDDETPITMYQAFLREIPTILFNAVAFVSQASYALAGTAIDRTELNPTETVFMFLAFPWGLAEVICCLKTVKRRAIHDFIAGTVVIRVDLGIGHDQKQGSVEI